MNLEQLRKYCLSFPGTSEDVKWENDLCFLVAEKMFCVVSLQPSNSVSFKVRDEEFDEMCERYGIIPAPYVARYKWVQLQNMNVLGKKELEKYIKQSYDLIKAKLPKKILNNL